MPLAQQRVSRALSALSSLLNPEPFSLERVARQRNPAALLSRVQPIEADVKSGFVSCRNGVDEAALRFR